MRLTAWAMLWRRLTTVLVSVSVPFILLSLFYPPERIYSNGFFVHVPQQQRPTRCHCRNSLPTRLQDWDHCDVEDWLRGIGFGRYTPGFASDFGGIGVDGDRLIYLGTEDQLDHIEYQLSLIGVNDESDQMVLGSTIIELVAASEVTPELLESLVQMVPAKNRDTEFADEGKDDSNDDSNDDNFGFQYSPPDFEI